MALARCGFKTAINKQDQTSNSMADKKWDGRNYFLQLGTCGITRLIVPSCTIQPMMMPQSTPDFHQSKQSKQFSTLPLIGNPQFIGGFPMFSSPAINLHLQLGILRGFSSQPPPLHQLSFAGCFSQTSSPCFFTHGKTENLRP